MKLIITIIILGLMYVPVAFAAEVEKNDKTIIAENLEEIREIYELIEAMQEEAEDDDEKKEELDTSLKHASNDVACCVVINYCESNIAIKECREYSSVIKYCGEMGETEYVSKEESCSDESSVADALDHILDHIDNISNGRPDAPQLRCISSGSGRLCDGAGEEN